MTSQNYTEVFTTRQEADSFFTFESNSFSAGAGLDPSAPDSVSRSIIPSRPGVPVAHITGTPIYLGEDQFEWSPADGF